jgi:hypothetical protein
MEIGGSTQRARRSVFVVLTAAAALPAAVATADHRPGHQGGGQGSNNVSIDATSPVTWGRSTTVTGKLTGRDNSGVSVELEADPYPFADNGFSRVATAATDANGDYRFVAQPTSHTRYRVVAKASPTITSSPTTVLVRIRVKVAAATSDTGTPRTFRLSGTACPEHDGKLAYIQRRTSTGRFRTVARAPLTDAGVQCSDYARRVTVRRDGVYRVKVPSRDADHSTGVSRRIRLNVG